jgi:hypothetical protein
MKKKTAKKKTTKKSVSTKPLSKKKLQKIEDELQIIINGCHEGFTGVWDTIEGRECFGDMAAGLRDIALALKLKVHVPYFDYSRRHGDYLTCYICGSNLVDSGNYKLECSECCAEPQEAYWWEDKLKEKN